MKLRDLPASERFFWKATTLEQVSQQVSDQNPDYDERKLTPNEIAALAFNEVAAKHRRGFFFHLPSRYAWTTSAEEARLPRERRPLPAGNQYANLYFMRYRWSNVSFNAFVRDPQRARFLRSSAIANPPQHGTPLIAIQYATQLHPVFHTDSPSLVLYATQRGYFLASSEELLQILGRDSADKAKLGSANWLWDRTSLDKGRDKALRRQRDQQMLRFRYDSLEDVFRAILQRSMIMSETLTVDALKSIIPRPASTTEECGTALGASLSANPRTRRGEQHKFAPRKRRKKGYEDVEGLGRDETR